MAIGDYEAVARAGRVLRAVPEHGWDEIEDRVIHAVRRTPRGGWPITVRDNGTGLSGTISVSDIVLRGYLARTLRNEEAVSPLDIQIEVDSGVLREVRVQVTGRYGADLHSAAERVVATCRSVIADVIGTAEGVSVEVVVTDIHR